jgi:crossover junction endodeoxyribonuclease RuvC
MFLGLDPSTRTGWCHLRGDGSYSTGEIFIRGKSGISRVVAFSDWLASFLQSNEITLIGIEGYGYANTHTLVPLVEIGTALRMVAHLSEIPYIVVPPTVLKKFATGTGNAKKELVMREVFRKWGFEGNSNNEADAFVLAKIVQALHTKGDSCTKTDYDSLKALLAQAQ